MKVGGGGGEGRKPHADLLFFLSKRLKTLLF